MKKRDLKNEEKNYPTYVTTGNVFEDIGFNKTESTALKIKSNLLIAIQKVVQKHSYTQRDLEKILNQPQPRISELLRGKVSRMSIDKLVSYLQRLGADTRVNVSLKETSRLKVASM